ncbi:hypothetical protein BC828DRAFT_389818 [Blastocladiella britannica]|nr:hypothetical protein BC828DRAFT_389818 [Blastocladiella britannica]
MTDPRPTASNANANASNPTFIAFQHSVQHLAAARNYPVLEEFIGKLLDAIGTSTDGSWLAHTPTSFLDMVATELAPLVNVNASEQSASTMVDVSPSTATATVVVSPSPAGPSPMIVNGMEPTDPRRKQQQQQQQQHHGQGQRNNGGNRHPDSVPLRDTSDRSHWALDVPEPPPPMPTTGRRHVLASFARPASRSMPVVMRAVMRRGQDLASDRRRLWDPIDDDNQIATKQQVGALLYRIKSQVMSGKCRYLPTLHQLYKASKDLRAAGLDADLLALRAVELAAELTLSKSDFPAFARLVLPLAQMCAREGPQSSTRRNEFLPMLVLVTIHSAASRIGTHTLLTSLTAQDLALPAVRTALAIRSTFRMQLGATSMSQVFDSNMLLLTFPPDLAVLALNFTQRVLPPCHVRALLVEGMSHQVVQLAKVAGEFGFAFGWPGIRELHQVVLQIADKTQKRRNSINSAGVALPAPLDVADPLVIACDSAIGGQRLALVAREWLSC